MAQPPSKTFKTTIYRDGPMCFIPVPFDPKPLFGKVRAPVVVTVNGYSYRSTIASMGDGPCVPLRKSNREAAKLADGETLNVTLALDADKREVAVPADLAKALRAAGALARFATLSYSHQREHVSAVEEAKKPETRARRVAGAVKMLLAMPARAAAAKLPKSVRASPRDPLRGPPPATQKPAQKPAPSTQKPGPPPKPPKPDPQTRKPVNKPGPPTQKPRQNPDIKDAKPAPRTSAPRTKPAAPRKPAPRTSAPRTKPAPPKPAAAKQRTR